MALSLLWMHSHPPCCPVQDPYSLYQHQYSASKDGSSYMIVCGQCTFWPMLISQCSCQAFILQMSAVSSSYSLYSTILALSQKAYPHLLSQRFHHLATSDWTNGSYLLKEFLIESGLWKSTEYLSCKITLSQSPPSTMATQIHSKPMWWERDLAKTQSAEREEWSRHAQEMRERRPECKELQTVFQLPWCQPLLPSVGILTPSNKSLFTEAE